MKRLLFDIEVSLGKYYAYRCGYNINLLPHQIIEEPKIICIAYKFAGEKRKTCLDWGKKKCDKAMIKKFVKIAESADEIIGHNSDRFDIKYIRTRCFFHKVPMMPDFVSVDTFKEAKKLFLYQSNGLDYINKYGGGPGKEKTEYALWVKTTEGVPSALKEMKKYCVSDVDRLEETYERMVPYMKVKSSVATYRCDCPRCGSENVGLRSNKISGAGVRYKQMQCKDCGQFYKLTESVENAAKKRKQVALEAAKKK